MTIEISRLTPRLRPPVPNIRARTRTVAAGIYPTVRSATASRPASSATHDHPPSSAPRPTPGRPPRVAATSGRASTSRSTSRAPTRSAIPQPVETLTSQPSFTPLTKLRWDPTAKPSSSARAPRLSATPPLSPRSFAWTVRALWTRSRTSRACDTRLATRAGLG